MNNPFDYEPHPLCLLAAEEVQRHIASQQGEWRQEADRGKMFGVLVAHPQPFPKGREANKSASSASKTDPRSGNTPFPLGRVGDGLFFLAAYSGQICDRAGDDYFVPAVFDYLQPDGYFKTHEAEISEINYEIAIVSTDSRRLELRQQLNEKYKEGEEAINKYSQMMAGAKLLRDKQRKNAFLSEADKESLIRESQFQKAQLRRLKKQYAAECMALEKQLAIFNDRIHELEHLRKEKSRALQQWLFTNFQLLNYKGETRNLQELFADTTFGEPPSGAGECCEPKLLHYAYSHGLRPLCMAMFWWGDSPKSEVRHHLHYYPACNGKCKPILKWMMPRPHPLPRGVVGDGLPILYEDDALIVINKPAGLLTIPGATTHLSVYSIIKERFSDSSASETDSRSGNTPLPLGKATGRRDSGNEAGGGLPSPSGEDGRGVLIVHRLDMDTSGLLVVAKTREAHKALQQQFTDHTVVKRYCAILDGILPEGMPREGEINLPLRPDLFDRPRQVVDYEHGKTATTHYHVDREEDGHTWITMHPLTGRTHQLRMHCAHKEGLNTPILGDPLYGRKSDRLYLHAEYLEFTHPTTGKRIHFEDKAPWIE